MGETKRIVETILPPADGLFILGGHAMRGIEGSARISLYGFRHTHLLFAPLSVKAWCPSTDVYRTAEGIVVKMEIAGIDGRNIVVECAGRNLVVQGTRSAEARAGRITYQQMEITYGQFRKEIVLPCTVMTKKKKIRYRNGFLEITLPLMKEVS